MNAMPDGEVVMLDLAGQLAVLVCQKPAIEPALLALGFTEHSTRMERPITDDADRKQLVERLVTLDVLFAEGAAWSCGGADCTGGVSMKGNSGSGEAAADAENAAAPIAMAPKAAARREFSFNASRLNMARPLF